MRRRSFLLSALLLGELRGAAAGGGGVRYASVELRTRLMFPRDHGAHPEFRTEWWYVTGALDAPRPDMGVLSFTGEIQSVRTPRARRRKSAFAAARDRGAE